MWIQACGSFPGKLFSQGWPSSPVSACFHVLCSGCFIVLCRHDRPGHHQKWTANFTEKNTLRCRGKGLVNGQTSLWRPLQGLSLAKEGWGPALQPGKLMGRGSRVLSVPSLSPPLSELGHGGGGRVKWNQT
jgi:hypothetical protein